MEWNHYSFGIGGGGGGGGNIWDGLVTALGLGILGRNAGGMIVFWIGGDI